MMSDETITWATRRIADHARKHELQEISIIFHGGEPLLVGPERLKYIARILREKLQDTCNLDLRLQTNGLLLDELFCQTFNLHDIKVGVSLDGDQVANDRHRRYADGRSSYKYARDAISLLRQPAYKHLYAGILCTVDTANDPISVYNSLLSLDPPNIDFLLPHATWDNPPLRKLGDRTEYGDWLLTIFNQWMLDGRPTRVRIFESIMRTAVDGKSLTEAIGLNSSDLVVIETDGNYEQADSLKAAFEGAPATGLDVFNHDLDEVATHEAIVARQLGIEGLCDQCRACPVVTVCGGGLYAHRYKTGRDFSNPSVYCADLLKLTSNIRQRKQIEAQVSDPRGPTHFMPAADFDTLASGHGGFHSFEYLIRSQSSVNRALLGKIHALAREWLTSEPALSCVDTAWEFLTQIDLINRKAVDKVLAHPFIRVWAVNTTELIEAEASNDGESAELTCNLGYLSAIAVAVAIHSGTSARITVPVNRRTIHIPTIGRLTIDKPTTAVTIEISRGGVFSVETNHGYQTIQSRRDASRPSTEAAGAFVWQAAHDLCAPGISVLLEDLDPYRDCYGLEAMPYLTQPQMRQWQHRFAGAWRLLQQDYGTYAEAMKAGLRAITPLFNRNACDISATARNAFGAISTALPEASETLALLLIHEFQHIKLGAILDLFTLYDKTDKRLFNVSWREDVRPLEGVLQGAYAHAAVTDYWRIRQHALVGDAYTSAKVRYTQNREATAEAIETLENSGSMTELGKRLLDGMRASVTR